MILLLVDLLSGVVGVPTTMAKEGLLGCRVFASTDKEGGNKIDIKDIHTFLSSSIFGHAPLELLLILP